MNPDIHTGSNGTYEPYANIQTLDSRFVKERFSEPATLWDMNPWDRMNLDDCDERDRWTRWKCEDGCNEPTDGMLESLHDAAGGCSGGFQPTKLWAKLDKNSLFAMVAVDRIINHADSLCGSTWTGNNYLLAHGHASGKFQLIPWGTDKSFQSWVSPKFGHTGTPGKNGKQWYGCDLMKDCFENQECEDDYDAAYNQVVDTTRASRQELLHYIALASSQVDNEKIARDHPNNFWNDTDIAKVIEKL